MYSKSVIYFKSIARNLTSLNWEISFHWHPSNRSRSKIFNFQQFLGENDQNNNLAPQPLKLVPLLCKILDPPQVLIENFNALSFEIYIYI